MNFLEICGIIYLACIPICALMFIIGYRNAQTEPPDTQIYEKEKARRNEPMTLEKFLDGEREAALIDWEDSQITMKDLTDIDELI